MFSKENYMCNIYLFILIKLCYYPIKEHDYILLIENATLWDDLISFVSKFETFKNRL